MKVIKIQGDFLTCDDVVKNNAKEYTQYLCS